MFNTALFHLTLLSGVKQIFYPESLRFCLSTLYVVSDELNVSLAQNILLSFCVVVLTYMLIQIMKINQVNEQSASPSIYQLGPVLRECPVISP